MQINKSKKSKRQPSNSLFDDDFSAGFEDSKLDKFKPAIKVLVVLILLVGIAWSVAAYFGRTDTKTGTDKDYTPNTTQQAEDNGTTEEAEDSAIKDSQPTSSSSSSSASTNNTDQHSSNRNSSTTKAYDSSKCEPLNSEATRLRQVANQKKTTYDNAFAARKSYGDFYSEVRNEYGSSSSMYEAVKAEADRRYNAQEAQLDTLQTDWQNALSTGNAAYSNYQECRATL